MVLNYVKDSKSRGGWQIGDVIRAVTQAYIYTLDLFHSRDDCDKKYRKGWVATVVAPGLLYLY